MNKYKVLCLFFVFCILSTFLYAQVDTTWVKRYNGLDKEPDWGSGTVVDAQGNVYVAGESYDNIQDVDAILIKYNSAGIMLWV